MKPIDPRIDPALVPLGSKAMVIAEHQDEYIDLPSVRTPAQFMMTEEGLRCTHPGYVITRWELTDDERKAILKGDDVYITLVTGGSIHPLFATVGPVDWSKDYE